MIISNVGFFGTGFGATACKHYQLAAPVTKRMFHQDRPVYLLLTSFYQSWRRLFLS